MDLIKLRLARFAGLVSKEQAMAGEGARGRIRRVVTLATFGCCIALSMPVCAQSYSRTDTTVYSDNLARWVLGQTASTSTNGIEVSRTVYDATTALPLLTYQYGKLQQTLTYNPDGTLATVRDGNSNVSTLSNWKRGIPQSIQHPATPEAPSGAIESAAVDNNGWLTSVTDENGYSTNYSYDAMGRMARVVYPINDSTVWNDTTQSFTQINAVEYGIASGHWKQTVSTGSGSKETYFDALLRPVVTREYDTANVVGTQRFTRRSYDDGGHLAFSSYPGTVDTLTNGVWTLYDTLDRPTSVSQDSEVGLLTTTTAYLTGFQTQVTNHRGKISTTSYMTYDQPNTDWPVAIIQPAGAYTDIVRNAFGKPTLITRRNAGNTLSATRSYVYDGFQQLCAQVEPETGTTVMDYDPAGNVWWSAAGLASTVGCNRTDPTIAARKVTRTYDARNREIGRAHV